ncbi:MAG TPA: PhoPQ-activated protein PqaA family protein, partial [Candidatus Hydrogenedentes bacterium]|nr:PhoPQ-activated protein PqaA family protein [Candidatus Hydrogenedentota bacterium]
SGLYNVKLTITNSKGASATATREVLVRAKVPPKAAFVQGINEIQRVFVSPSSAGSFTLTFRGHTTAAIAYNGDGTAVQKALEALPSIGQGGVTVTGAAGGPFRCTFQGALAQKNLEPLIGNAAKLTAREDRDYVYPVAEITVVTQQDGMAGTPALVGTTMQFLDASTAGSMPISQRRWHVEGQGQTFDSVLPELSCTFAQPGDYDLSLKVTTAHGENEIRQTIRVEPPPLVAAFFTDKPRALTSSIVKFTDESKQGNLPISQWLWTFGDGQSSTQRDPIHMYTTPGQYTVTLEVTGLGGAKAKTQQMVHVFASRPLDNYIALNDDNFAFREESQPTVIQDVMVHTFEMTSQRWRKGADEEEGEKADPSDYEVNRSLWQHCMTVLKPAGTTNRIGLLLIEGGSNGGECSPGSDVIQLAQFAKEANTVVALIEQVPNEPLIFANDPDKRYTTSGRTEDEIIAFSYDRYLRTMDATWPALLPMTKSAVRAMDAVQDLLRNPLNRNEPLIRQFVVTGASKRGWTTWLTGAADPRVTAIAPIVIDVLNMAVQMEHHRAVYGGFSSAIQDYVDLHVFERFNTVAGQALLKIVDPFQYRDRLTMPKLIINSTGDEFFVPDSAQYYFKQLGGENYLTYAPNTNHGMGGYTTAAPLLAPWFQSIAAGKTDRPAFSWTASDDNTRIEVVTQTKPDRVLLWKATSSNRDFRLSTNWSSSELPQTALNRYVAEPARSQTAWTGFFVQVIYESAYALNGES